MAEAAAVDTGSSNSQATTSTQPAGGGGASLLSGGATAPAANGNGTAAPATQTQGEPAAAGNDNWRSRFATGLAEEEKKVWDNLSGRYTSETDMAKAHVSLVRSMDKRIPIPDENAKPEEWDQVYNKLGRPETPDKYQFEFPADAPWDETQRAHIKGLAPLFHKNGATQKQVNEFVRQQAELDKVAADAFRAKANTTQQTYDKTLQQEWGGDFQRNQNLAATFVKTYAGADVETAAGLQLADGTYVLDHPVMRRMFAKAGLERAEDDRDPTAFNSGATASAKSQIDQIYEEMKTQGITPSDPRFPHAKIEALSKKAYGSRNDYGRSY